MSEAYDEYAPYYDLAETARDAEIRFYRSLVRPSDRSFLELGCGTGRILSAVAGPVIDAHGPACRAIGIDHGARMLERAREREPRITWIQADLAEPPVEGPFDFVMCPFNTLQMLDSHEQALKTFRAVRALLADDGMFVFDLYNATRFEDEPDHPPIKDRVARVFEDAQGRTLKIVEDEIRVPGVDSMTLDWRVLDAADVAGAPVARFRFTLRHYGARDIERLLDSAGLKMRERYGDIGRKPFSPRESVKQVVVCGR